MPKLDGRYVTFELVSVVCRRIALFWYVTISTKLHGLTYHVTTDVEVYINEYYWDGNMLAHNVCHSLQLGHVSGRRKFTCSSHLTPAVTELCPLLINYDRWRGWKVEMHNLAK